MKELRALENYALVNMLFCSIISQRYIKYTLVHSKNFQPTLSISALFRHSFKTVMFSRFLGSYSNVLKALSFQSLSQISAATLQSSYSFGKIQNLGGPELSEKKVWCFIEGRFHISSSLIFFRQFCFLFPSFLYINLNQHEDFF